MSVQSGLQGDDRHDPAGERDHHPGFTVDVGDREVSAGTEQRRAKHHRHQLRADLRALRGSGDPAPPESNSPSKRGSGSSRMAARARLASLRAAAGVRPTTSPTSSKLRPNTS